MAICPANCADPELIPVPDAGCETKRRKSSIFKIGFFACSTVLPDPLTCDSLETMIDSNQIVFSSPLVNVEVADPETEDVVISDCLPAVQEVIGRQMTFEDHIAIDIQEGPSGVPAENLFADIKFWGNKNKYKTTLRQVFLYCDGRVEVPRDDMGNPLSGTFNVWRNFTRQGTGGNSYILEIKRGSINFKGDPFAMREDYAPDLIIDSSVDCLTLATKLGLSL